MKGKANPIPSKRNNKMIPEEPKPELPSLKEIPDTLVPMVNSLVGCLENFYTALCKKNYYLPIYKSKKTIIF